MIASLTSQHIFYNNMRLDADVNCSIISRITAMESTNIDNLCSLSLSDDANICQL